MKYFHRSCLNTRSCEEEEKLEWEKLIFGVKENVVLRRDLKTIQKLTPRIVMQLKIIVITIQEEEEDDEETLIIIRIVFLKLLFWKQKEIGTEEFIRKPTTCRSFGAKS